MLDQEIDPSSPGRCATAIVSRSTSTRPTGRCCCASPVSASARLTGFCSARTHTPPAAGRPQAPGRLDPAPAPVRVTADHRPTRLLDLPRPAHARRTARGAAVAVRMTYTVTLHQPDDLTEFRDRRAQTSGRRHRARAMSPGPARHDTTLFADALAGRRKDHRQSRAPSSISPMPWSAIATNSAGPCCIRPCGASTTASATLMHQPADPLLHRLRRMAAAVRHDQHRMTAFLRFRSGRRCRRAKSTSPGMSRSI